MQTLNPTTKFHIRTFGCQMNEHDSETIAGLLIQEGMASADKAGEADIVIINTCSVRENADKSFFGTLGQFKKKKEQNPEFIVCVGGCMMQQQHIVDSLKKKYPWVDIVFGTHNLQELPGLIKNVKYEKSRLVDVWEEAGDIIEGLPAKRLFKHKAYVNIMYGCDNFCSYCIVPYTRGRERSRKPGDIVDEVKKLVEDGVIEITLLGQNVNSYKPDFTGLLYDLSDIEGLERIRFMTSHPKDLSDDLIRAFSELPKLCNYIHLPVQSGDNNILSQMNRRYTREDYLTLIEKLREAVPDIAISTDIIVGFPGETEEEFENTLDLCKRVGFDSAFTFLYSVRKGTPAADFVEQVPEEVKHERFNRLVAIINESSAIKNSEYAGRVEKVLVESLSKRNTKTFSGRTESFKLVNFKADMEDMGKIINVRITEAKTFSLDGEKVV